MNNNKDDAKDTEPKNTWVDWKDDKVIEPYDPDKDDFDARAVVQELLRLANGKKINKQNE